MSYVLILGGDGWGGLKLGTPPHTQFDGGRMADLVDGCECKTDDPANAIDWEDSSAKALIGTCAQSRMCLERKRNGLYACLNLT